jgi:hypothetical protein
LTGKPELRQVLHLLVASEIKRIQELCGDEEVSIVRQLPVICFNKKLDLAILLISKPDLFQISCI